ncbi:MAG TPA: sigma-70 family RNA polymerase sigma factor [Vicinamibacterales bacterium]|jgi:RNA polymerase sigma-70 factor (ECF subfamily)|nr:sigma-70 family RNA polymerase sigma factor [Vicinamibacterales bacterium]
MNNLSHPASTASAQAETFEEAVLPHLDAGYRLARWLLRNDEDADDVVQEASLRAFRYFRTFVGGDSRAWFLTIVRNSCSSWQRRRLTTLTDPFDEEDHLSLRSDSDPEALLLQADDATLVARAMRKLPDRLHQVLALREFHGLSYRELAEVIGTPVGTVMSRLSRAREALRIALDNELKPSRAPGFVREQREDAIVA